MAYPQQTYYQPAPPARKRRNKAWAGIGIMAALMLAVCGLSFVGYALLSDDLPTEQQQQPTVQLGQPARDGKFEFTVTKVQCGIKHVGSKLTGEDAQGQFCLVTITVKNIGNEARTFTAGNQKAHGAGGVEYSPDTLASLDANGDTKAFLNDINPGNSVTAVVAFDIPADAKLVSVELHDSAFSGGVTVAV